MSRQDDRQPLLPYVVHNVEGEIIGQRKRDGFINATAMCQAAGKRWFDYARLSNTGSFLIELSRATGIPVSELTQTLTGGNPAMQGTWVHPQVAINLAQWCSPKFAVLVTKWVYDWMSGALPTVTMPYHLRRYTANQKNVPVGHFSVLNEMIIALIAPLEAGGYTLPETLWPDISQGIMFAKYMKDEHHITTGNCPTYTHVFEDRRPPVQARAYPEEYLPDFRRHLREVWLPQRAIAYFKERDPAALPHLEVLLLPAPK
jgi:hypothetical protein